MSLIAVTGIARFLHQPHRFPAQPVKRTASPHRFHGCGIAHPMLAGILAPYGGAPFLRIYLIHFGLPPPLGMYVANDSVAVHDVDGLLSG